jgi:hypothetical protein
MRHRPAAYRIVVGILATAVLLGLSLTALFYGDSHGVRSGAEANGRAPSQSEADGTSLLESPERRSERGTPNGDSPAPPSTSLVMVHDEGDEPPSTSRVESEPARERDVEASVGLRLRLVDTCGDPLGNAQITFLVDGEKRIVIFGSKGTIRIEIPDGSLVCLDSPVVFLPPETIYFVESKLYDTLGDEHNPISLKSESGEIDLDIVCVVPIRVSIKLNRIFSEDILLDVMQIHDREIGYLDATRTVTVAAGSRQSDVDLRPGEYLISRHEFARNFWLAPRRFTVDECLDESVEVEPLERESLELVELHGCVKRPNGEPLSGGTVFADFTGSEIDHAPPVPVGSAITDDGGRFRITSVPRGPLRLSFEGNGEGESLALYDGTGKWSMDVVADGQTHVDVEIPWGCALILDIVRGALPASRGRDEIFVLPMNPWMSRSEGYRAKFVDKGNALAVATVVLRDLAPGAFDFQVDGIEYQAIMKDRVQRLEVRTK